jgi:hypothetical protein
METIASCSGACLLVATSTCTFSRQSARAAASGAASLLCLCAPLGLLMRSQARARSEVTRLLVVLSRCSSSPSLRITRNHVVRKQEQQYH